MSQSTMFALSFGGIWGWWGLFCSWWVEHLPGSKRRQKLCKSN